MTSAICLRIFVGKSTRAETQQLEALVRKVVTSFLEKNWPWPKRHGEIAPYAFALADPNVDVIDPDGLRALSAALHQLLFGTESEGEVLMAALEGDPDKLSSFATADRETALAMLAATAAGTGGQERVSYITPDGVETLPPRTHPVLAAAGRQICFSGIYHLPRESFVGVGLSARSADMNRLYNITDGAKGTPDSEGIAAEMAALEATADVLDMGLSNGLIFVPVSYASLVNRVVRQTYEPLVERLHPAQRNRLAACIYDTPRLPVFQALSQIQTFLSARFGFIDLQVNDPYFEIDYIPMGMINSVTLILPEGTEHNRINLISRFMAARDKFKRRQVWPAITNLQTQRELDHCEELKVPFVTGAAVCPLMETSVGGLSIPRYRLPWSGTQSSPLHHLKTA